MFNRKQCSISTILLATILVFSGCSSESKTSVDSPLRTVRTINAGSADQLSGRSFPGVVDANQKATLSFRVTGKLESLVGKEGMPVIRGQVLATLDDDDFQIQLADAQATYSRAKADFERAAQLVERGHVSKADYDKLRANAASAKANLDSAEKRVAYSTLKAPFSGQIAKRFVENFQEVSASQTIFLIQDLSSLEVKVDIPSSLMVNSSREKGLLDINAQFDAIPERQFPLSVKEIATVADDVTQTYTVTLTMENVDGYSILPGMTTTVTATPKKNTDDKAALGEIVVPSQSVMGNGSEAFVWVLEPDPDSDAGKTDVGVIKRVNVVVGEVLPTGLQILSGLERGESVVTAGMSKLSDGQQVRLLKGQ
ncbi:hypothetical protein A3742_16300 [Oleiphilus sp. HI0071]|nr:efflux RND transporter periplasmic adaptor subunit [Oleiphilus sp. HI0080]KZY73307.1 hypothetical protein A3737_16360 [Oleiphilus sp. HI0065]KZY86700.1 hypothetical protein A3742_16300 [Oleiphilus sp. HI0071]KZZ05784.1 hypothetical protein A3744_15865 [Oleiphilus sp. HI0073]KZZ43442.1 hypothetical protein A3758_15235 [Oleiphilus sp. HI0118]KZZ48747.1 hypothetical protein A3760_15340 [Oleiphilus sp. HI0122]KZZ72904.1 hypothetical protein A3765_12845 [Oleiphilus sp. HI0130]